MEIKEIAILVTYVGLCILTLLFIIKITNRRTIRPGKKSPGYMHISSDEDMAFSKDIYDLDWKPPRHIDEGICPEIMKTLDAAKEISPLLIELSSTLNDPQINPKDVSQLIVSDQGLTAFILKRVNSPYYGLVQKVDNIFNAIIILGYNEIYRIVMEERIKKAGIMPPRDEWVHANLTSSIAAYLASTSSSGISAGPMVTMGMLHNIGKTIIRESIRESPDGFPSDPRDIIRKEIEIYGIDHATLGGEMARRWGIPEKLCSTVEKYHWPMYWSLRDTAQEIPDIIREISFLCISSIAAYNYTNRIKGTYIGPDYYAFIKKTARMDSILSPEIRRDLDRIKKRFPKEEQ
ncbi:MAG: HDOD domain-containing protein [Thermodesulfobacteriota bacterium]|nr:HDOD domain-containing protein [Thermodesulfobacteriota bacterium]